VVVDVVVGGEVAVAFVVVVVVVAVVVGGVVVIVAVSFVTDRVVVGQPTSPGRRPTAVPFLKTVVAWCKIVRTTKNLPDAGVILCNFG
jgi:hypothetical protein